jgi:aspartate/methionine/tyrosine aminotransferase
MFAATRYLDWARRLYGHVRFDLASSGIPTAPLAEWAAATRGARDLDDPSAWAKLPAAIARHNDANEDDAVAALGTTHALWLAYSALTSPGDEILVEAPGYEPVTCIAEGLGLRVRTFERPPPAGFAIDPARVRAAITPATRVVVVTNLHNPSGARTSDATLRELAAIADERRAFLLVDEVYAPFDGLVGADGVFRGGARKLAPNIVTVSSLTKCYGLGPTRVGWMLAPPEIAARARNAVIASAGMLPLVHAHLALDAFAQLPSLAHRARTAMAGKRAHVGAWVASQGLTWSAPGEGLFGFVSLERAARDLTARVEAMASARGVLVAPGDFFGAPEGFRLAWSAPSDALDQGLAQLAAALPDLMR